MIAPRLHRGFSAADACEEAARFLAIEMKQSIGLRGRARIALAGGSTPKRAYERLAEEDLRAVVDWDKVEVFFGDERSVPPSDPASNFRMADAALLSRVPIRKDHVHRIEGELDPPESARRYGSVLGDSPLDVVLLGMGDDGHVASLFPGSPALDGTDPVMPSVGPVAPTSRVTLGYSALNAARVVALLVTGAAKAARLAEAYSEIARGEPALPVSRIDGRGGRYHWFFDAEAGVRLPGGTEESS